MTDTHIGPDPDFRNYGHSPLGNLTVLVETINALTFPADFVLHTGDVVEDRSEAAYRNARDVLSRLKLPVHYVAGNHDDPEKLQRTLLGRAPLGPRMDYSFEAAGVQVAVFDTRGPNDPGGTLLDDQRGALRALCSVDGPPLVIAVHHPPLPLDTPWLDKGWRVKDGKVPTMLLDCAEEFAEAVAPARERLRGVFFGHVHRSFQVMHRGVLYASAGSSFGQLLAWPDTVKPEASPAEPAGFSVVTVTREGTVIRQHTLPRPVDPRGPSG
jgi:Icc protein